LPTNPLEMVQIAARVFRINVQENTRMRVIGVVVMCCAAAIGFAQNRPQGVTKTPAPAGLTYGSPKIHGPSVSHMALNSASEQLKGLRALGFFQVGNVWAYQGPGMAKPMMVAQLPVIKKSMTGAWVVVTPAQLTSKPVKLPSNYAR
jgi:hypothetical protein